MRTPALSLTTLHRLFILLTCARLTLFFSDVTLVTAAQSDPHLALRPNLVENVIPESEFVDQTNMYREEAGLAPLKENDQLTAAAEAKVEDMVANNYWDHFRPSDGKAPWDFVDEAGYHYKVAGENLARGFRTAGGITQAWMASPAHAANLLSAKYQDVGFASAYSYDQSGERVILTVQMLGAK